MKILKTISIVLMLIASIQAEEVPKPDYGDALEKANALHNKGDLVKAEKAYRTLRSKDLEDALWAKATNNLGMNLKAQKKYQKSINIFSEILDRKLNNREKGEYIMEHYRNYHYKACIQIMWNYYKLKKFDKALEYLDLTRTKYKYESCCGSCLDNNQKSYNKILKFLKEEK